MSTQYVYEPNTSGKVILNTTAGEIEIELWCKECPLTCRNFIQLCAEGYYDGTIFHRIVRDFIIQGGDPTGTGDGGESSYGKPFKDEFHQRLSFNRRGLLGMANNGPDQNRSQFFITIGNEGLRGLTKKHTLFGQVVGKTVFNMLNIAECDVDEHERPKRPHKIVSTKIIKHPFDDIIVREKTKEKKKDKDRKEHKKAETKKLNLLSFGDEAEEDEEELTKVNQKLSNKGKSAHDVLNDDKLSTQVAVTKDEMTNYNPDQDEDREDADAALEKVKNRFAKKRKINEDEEEKDEDLEKLIDEEAKRKKQEEMDSVKEELHKMQKEYIRALRPKEDEKEKEEEPQTEAMKTYHSLKMKFKSKGHTLGIKKWKDPARQEQTMNLLSKFTQKLQASNQTAILFDKKVVIPQPVAELEEDDDKKFGVDLDAEDTPGTEWMKHTFVAEDIDPNVTKAKDANTKDQNEEWYPLNDPRNLLNKMRRGET